MDDGRYPVRSSGFALAVYGRLDDGRWTMDGIRSSCFALPDDYLRHGRIRASHSLTIGTHTRSLRFLAAMA
jgi:hypothetical protein